MRITGLALLVLGAALLVLGLLLTILAGWTSMPSYLADWLFWSSLPVGALPVVMLVDLAGPGAGFGLEPALRRLLWLTPLAAIAMIPVLVRPNELFGWATGHSFSTPFGKVWMSHVAFLARSVIYYVIWTFMAVLFIRPATLETIDRRRALAAICLFIFVLTATLASVDWAMTVEWDWISPEFGLLLMTSQATIAISVALLLAGDAWRRAAPEAAASFLLIGTAAWMFVQFIQFLVIWSADDSSDITWYLNRSDMGSRLVVALCVAIGFVIPLFALLSPRARRRPRVLPAMAVLVLCAQALTMLWLITPSLRHYFTVSFLDAVEMFGIGGIMLGVCLLGGPVKHAGPVEHV